jgi:hypothetical protein
MEGTEKRREEERRDINKYGGEMRGGGDAEGLAREVKREFFAFFFWKVHHLHYSLKIKSYKEVIIE